MSMSESIETIRSKRARQHLVEEKAAKDGARKTPARPQVPVETREVDRQEFDAVAQRSVELVEAGRHVVGLASDDNLLASVRLGLDERGDRPDRRRKERAVRRETISSPHAVPLS